MYNSLRQITLLTCTNMDQNQDLLRRLLEAERTAREAIEERNAAREERDAEKAAREAAEDAA